MLDVLVNLERHRRELDGGNQQSEFDIEHYLCQGLATLSARQRLNFELRTKIKHPLKKLIKGASA